MVTTTTGTSDNDTIYGTDGEDSILGGAGDDYVMDYNGDDTLSGGSGDDQLYDMGGTNLLLGDDGNDYLEGHGTLHGGTGNDTLMTTGPYGQGSGDTYLFNLGDGSDTIVEYGTANPYYHTHYAAADTIVFGPGIQPADILHARSGYDLVLSVGPTDQLTIQDWFASDARHIERFVFDDGTVLGIAEMLGMQTLNVMGTTGDDLLFGSDGIDHIQGLAGNDSSMYDSPGNDTLSGGSGDDQLYDYQGYNLLQGGAGNDTLAGHGIFHGGAGNDTLYGNIGGLDSGDTYLFNLGDGVDTIVEYSSATGDDTQHAAIDFIVFGPGILPANVQLSREADSDDLVISVSVNDRLIIQNWLYAPGSSIERFVFDDGTVWSTADLLGMTQHVVGTAGDDYFSYSESTDYQEGLAGNDFLSNSPGNDTLSGGSGDDWITDYQGSNLLLGGDGNDHIEGHGTFHGGAGSDTLVGNSHGEQESGDTYLFHLGDGSDTLIERGNNDDSSPGGADDTIVFGPGILPGDVLRSRVGDDLVLSVSTNDHLTLQGWFSSDVRHVERFVFDDGTVWSIDDLLWGMTTLSVVGTAGDDALSGSTGIDHLEGLAGNDTLGGSRGNDTLSGGSGDDQISDSDGINLLQGDDGNDHIEGHGTFHGGAGNDTLIASGTHGANSGDTYLFNLGDGADTIVEYGTTDSYYHTYYAAADTIVFGPGIAPADILRARSANDLVFSVSPDDHLTLQGWFSSDEGRIERFVFSDGTVWSLADVLGMTLSAVGTAGDDALLGSDGVDHMEGMAGNDTLGSSLGDDTLSGGSGDDQLSDSQGNNLLLGGDGNDYIDGHGTLHGGTGNDTLVASGPYGEQSSDTYLFNLGDGADTIVESPLTLTGFTDNSGYHFAVDTIVFGPSILPADILRTRSANDLVLSVSADDHLTLQGWFAVSTDYQRIERFVFDDGTVWSLDDVLGMTLSAVGTAGDDALLSSDGIDHQEGLAGNDTFTDSEGNDTLSGGSGDDQISDSQGTNLLLGGDGNDYIGGHGTLYGGAGNDQLYGSGTLHGGTGSDTLSASGAPAVTYLFHLGDGADTIAAAGSGVDETLVFGPGIVPADILRTRSGDDFVFSISADDHLTLQGWFSYYPSRIERFVFDDGTVWSLADVLGMTLNVVGTDGDDYLSGSDGIDHLEGLAGNDILEGSQGNDTLSGGSGHDQLYDQAGSNLLLGGDGDDSLSGHGTLHGGAGNDTLYASGTDGANASYTYLFNLGDGADTIVHYTPYAGSAHTIVFGPGILPADILRTRSADDLVFSVSADDHLTVQGWFSLNEYRIERFVFDDGTVWSLADVLGMALTTVGTSGNDSLPGSSGIDHLEGLAGNDTLSSSLGDDTLSGGSGDDQISDGEGNNLLLGGDGDDSLFGHGTLHGGAGIDTPLRQRSLRGELQRHLPLQPRRRPRHHRRIRHRRQLLPRLLRRGRHHRLRPWHPPRRRPALAQRRRPRPVCKRRRPPHPAGLVLLGRTPHRAVRVLRWHRLEPRRCPGHDLEPGRHRWRRHPPRYPAKRPPGRLGRQRLPVRRPGERHTVRRCRQRHALRRAWHQSAPRRRRP